MAVEVLNVPLRATDREMLGEQRLDVAHEGACAAHHHLDEQRLALLERHAAVAPDRLVAPVLR